MSNTNEHNHQQSMNPYQAYYYYPQTRQMPAGQIGQSQDMLPIQQSYIENILRLNKGKHVIVYMTFDGNQKKTFKGIVEAAGRDHIILSDPDTGKRYLLLMVYLDYVTFDEEINYSYPFNQTGMLANYPPR